MVSITICSTGTWLQYSNQIWTKVILMFIWIHNVNMWTKISDKFIPLSASQACHAPVKRADKRIKNAFTGSNPVRGALKNKHEINDFYSNLISCLFLFISRSQRIGNLSPKQVKRMFDSFTRCDAIMIDAARYRIKFDIIVNMIDNIMFDKNVPDDERLEAIEIFNRAYNDGIDDSMPALISWIWFMVAMK